jgi:ribosomal protein S18 acetylase RimI-like enzyme
VREDNEVARALYLSIGFESAYRYTHRVMPGRKEGGPPGAAPAG